MATWTVLYLDDSGPSADAATTAMGLADYRVHHAYTVDDFQRLILEHGPVGNGSLSALVLDISASAERADAVSRALKSDPELSALPVVYLIRPDQTTPAGERAMALKRPFASPALVRLLDYAVKSSSAMSAPGRTMVAKLDPMRRVGVGTSTVGDYELISEIASGGMGTVFLAQRRNDAGFVRLFALKLMHAHHVSDTDVPGMFLDEATIASRIHHPNVAAVVDLGTEGERPYVVIQYVEGCAFSQLLRGWEGPRPLELVLPIVLDTLAGLQAAHELTDDDDRLLNFIHRDVSPENVLVGLDGIARITDFGVAKARGRITTTRKGVRKGKLLYLAPEQLLESDNMDARLDVFATGVVLWNALTGKKLFSAESPAGVMRNILEGEIPDPSAIDPRIPPDLDAVCRRALCRDPDERYSSARQMAVDLRAVAGSRGMLGTPEAVGAWVESLYGTELRARRRTVQVARSNGSPSDSNILGLSASTMTPASVDDNETVVRSPVTTTMTSTGSTQQIDEPPPRRHGLALVLFGTLAGSLAATGVVLNCGGSRSGADPVDREAQVRSASPVPNNGSPSAKANVVPPAPRSTPPPGTVPPGAVLDAPDPGSPASKATPEAEPSPEAPPTPTGDTLTTQPEPEPSSVESKPAPPPSRTRSKRRKRAPAPTPEPAPVDKPDEPVPTPAPKPRPAPPSDPLGSGPESNPYKR